MKKILLWLTLLAFLLVIGFAAIVYYKYIAGSEVPEDIENEYVYIPTGAEFEDVVSMLKAKGIIQHEETFRLLAERMNYKRSPMRSGRFRVQGGWSAIDLIRHLRNGRQAPVDVVLTNERLIENVAAKVARFIEPDSVTLLELMQDENYLQEIGYTPETLMSLFIPNTYEFYWNTQPLEFMSRMQREHKNFWEGNQRAAKAEALGMSPAEVYTLASIIEKETLRSDEKPRMAGVYLNRLQKGMLLQADPTAVFATREFDVGRVLNRHIQFDSPYNTYIYPGLPPGPISMASISSIDAVLNAEDHDYIYFCAKGDGSGYHSFAETLQGHNQNVARYRENLRKRGLR